MTVSLANGTRQLSIPGPSVLPEAVLSAMHRASPNIYGEDLVGLASSVYPDLCKVAGTAGDAVVYIGNGHAAWEASLCNTLSRGDKVLALVTGRFTKGWIDVAEPLGIDFEVLDFGGADAVDSAQVEEVLKEDKSHQIKAVITVHADTASSVLNDIPALRKAMDAAGHPALLMVDCIASLACDRFLMDDWGVDVLVAACQKGLMTPAGLSFNFIGKKAWQAHAKADLKTGYWDWDRRVNGKVFYQKFCGTPPSHHLFGLRAALDMLLDEGMENVWQRHQRLAAGVWAAVDQWGKGYDDGIRCNIANPSQRTTAVTTVRTGNLNANDLRQWCESNAGVTLGIGLSIDAVFGGNPDNLFRIGHMGHLNAHMLLGTLATIDTGLKALGYEHGDAALDAAAAALASPGGSAS